MATQRRRLLFIGLTILLVASLWRTTSVERQRHQLTHDYAQAQQMLQQLESERDHLNQALSQARQTIDGQSADMGNLRQELQGLAGQLTTTRAELTSLQQQHASLTADFNAIKVEKDQLQAKLSSLKELRLAIRDVKRQMWQTRLAAWQMRIRAQRDADLQRLASGNRGFLVRDGVPTLGSGPRLHVHVLEPQTQ